MFSAVHFVTSCEYGATASYSKHAAFNTNIIQIFLSSEIYEYQHGYGRWLWHYVGQCNGNLLLRALFTTLDN